MRTSALLASKFRLFSANNLAGDKAAGPVDAAVKAAGPVGPVIVVDAAVKAAGPVGPVIVVDLAVVADFAPPIR